MAKKEEVAKYSGQVLFSREDGEILSATSNKIVVRKTTGKQIIWKSR